MNKILLVVLALFLKNSCSYKPILTDKENDFTLENISTNNETKINVIIKKNLIDRSDNSSNNNYDLYFSTENKKEVVSSNESGDPTIFKIKIIVNYSLSKDGNIIFTNKIIKQVNYNNINDKFELLEYEENILNNLLKNISQEILMSITNLN